MTNMQTTTLLQRENTNSTGPRRGAALAMMIVITVLVTGLLAGLVRQVFVVNRQARLLEDSLQADWLAEAGVARGLAQLQQNPDYAGEDWTISAEQLNGSQAGVVKIERLPADAAQKLPERFRVTARFPVGDGQPAQRILIQNLNFSKP